jgi:hypothetical protein
MTLQVVSVSERALETFMDFDGFVFQRGLNFPPRKSQINGRIMPNGNQVVGSCGEARSLVRKPTPNAHDKKCNGKRKCICRAKLKTTKDVMAFLRRVDDHFEYNGLPGFGFFEKPLEVRKVLNRAIRATKRKWVPSQPTRRKKLKKHLGLAPRKQRSAYATRMLVFTKATVKTMRAATDNLYGQGFLKHDTTVYPYTRSDVFHANHRVNVYRMGSRFDVVDANCNLMVKAGISRAELRKVVKW